MLEVLKEIIPVEAIGPAIGGALVWFGANYAFIAPEMIGPRLQEKYYLPACEEIVEKGQKAAAQEEAALTQQFEERLDRVLAEARQKVGQGAGMFFDLYGDQGRQFWQKWGGDITGSVGGMAEMSLQAQASEARRDFEATLNERRAKARAATTHTSAAAYCGCKIDEAFEERAELALYSASLRFYTPPMIKNIESGVLYSKASSCGAMPTV